MALTCAYWESLVLRIVRTMRPKGTRVWKLMVHVCEDRQREDKLADELGKDSPVARLQEREWLACDVAERWWVVRSLRERLATALRLSACDVSG
jgi:hypothetical protein